jgi:hypothetical protein
MAWMYRHGHAIPLWAAAAAAAALSTQPRVTPSVLAFVGVAAVGCAISAFVQRRRRFRPLVEVLPAIEHPPAGADVLITAGAGARMLDEALDARHRSVEDAADLIRMDDDGGWRGRQARG